MILLNVEGIRKHYGPEPVLSNVTFEVRPGNRIGLVGPNGAGKTTLLKILYGREDADAGVAEYHPSVKVGFLEQQAVFEPGRTLWDEAEDALSYLIDMQRESIEVADKLAQATDQVEHDRLAARYDHLQHELLRHDAFHLDHKIQRVLEGLGFDESTFQNEARSLSGGEMNRLNLAKLLLAEPDLMYLDEPSNHLDIEATEWLESFLTSSRAAMILVSHDRYFLDRVTNRTLELFRGTIDDYTGNFSAYWKQKQERVLVQERTYEKQQIELEKTKDFIRRHSYGQKHAQAEDRRKKLERLEAELVEPPRNIEVPPMRFPEPTRTGDVVFRTEKLGKSYGKRLFADVNLRIERGQRWAILGPNGCGKTTLLRCLLGHIAPDEGTIHHGAGVDIGYFDQQLHELDDDDRVVDSIRPKGREFDEPQRRNLLARFGITGDTALQPVGSLSGGERCRAALARLAAAEANVMVLDEPTNHLDLWACDALEKAVTTFAGTVLFVSHDRYFVDQTADHLLIVEPEGVRVVEGNYSFYQQLLSKDTASDSRKDSKSQSGKKQNADTGSEAKKPDSKNNARANQSKRKRKFPFRKVADIEAEIFERESRVEELNELMLQPEVLRDGALIKEYQYESAEQQDTLQTLYEHWEEANELNW